MKLTFKSFLIFLLAGIVIVILGALLKLMHLPLSTVLLASGMIVEAIALVGIILEIVCQENGG